MRKYSRSTRVSGVKRTRRSTGISRTGSTSDVRREYSRVPAVDVRRRELDGECDSGSCALAVQIQRARRRPIRKTRDSSEGDSRQLKLIQSNSFYVVRISAFRLL